LDQIPFILTNIQKRRASFERSSQMFFLATIVFGLLSAGIIIAYGFVLVDQITVGLARHVGSVRASMEDLSDLRSDYDSLEFRIRALKFSDYERDSWKASGARADALEFCGGREFRELGFGATGNKSNIVSMLDRCEEGLAQLRLSIQSIDPDRRRRLEGIVGSKETAIEAITKRVDKLAEDRAILVSKVTEDVKTAETASTTGDSRLYELLKRLSVGAIVVTFLLAILRYLARQYSEHLSHMGKADQDDIAIRRFFVALANASNSDERSAAIKQFIGGSMLMSSANGASPGAEVNAISEQDKKIVGDILDIVKKRI
jgi:hypothetical protein